MFVFASVLELQKQPKTHDSFNHGECSGSDQKTLIRIKRGGGGGWGGLKSGEDRGSAKQNKKKHRRLCSVRTNGPRLSRGILFASPRARSVNFAFLGFPFSTLCVFVCTYF